VNIWLITIGEPLPTDAPDERLLRTGLLGRMLADQGHQVTWWTSNFDHVRKKHRFSSDHVVALRANLTIRLLHGCGYPRNVSIRRMVDHRQLARKFRRQSRAAPRPDVILCSFPPIELALEAVVYGQSTGVPVALDVRDLWPDIFLNLAPKPLRPIARALLSHFFRLTSTALSGADAVLAINEGFVEWGVRYAHRPRGALDRAFPMAYPSGVPTADEQGRAKAFWRTYGVNESAHPFKAMFAGTFGRQVEFDTIVAAARELPDIQFILCGAGDFLEHVRELSFGLPNIVLPGWVGATEIWTLMRMAHVGLAPYHSEESFTHSLPNKSLEYLSAGLPIVSSLSGALERLLAEQRCGLTFAIGDAPALRDAFRRLRDEPQWRSEMADNAKVLFEARFRAEAVYAEMIAHLERLVRMGAARRAEGLVAD
jgi:glycosyltransferase involved in cell wall biosynthesis